MPNVKRASPKKSVRKSPKKSVRKSPKKSVRKSPKNDFEAKYPKLLKFIEELNFNKYKYVSSKCMKEIYLSILREFIDNLKQQSQDRLDNIYQFIDNYPRLKNEQSSFLLKTFLIYTIMKIGDDINDKNNIEYFSYIEKEILPEFIQILSEEF